MQILPDSPGVTSGETSSESSPSPQTPLDADGHFLHAAMNQPLVQTSLYSQNYSLQTDPDCIDQLGHATGISYTNGGVSNSARRDSELNHQPSTLTRPLGHRSSTNDPSFHPPPEQSSGSISTSPSSNNSSAAYSFVGSQRQPFSSPLSLPNLQHPFSHSQPLSNNSTSTFQLPQTFGSGMQTRLNEHTSNYLPSQRSGVSSISNPVSPNGGSGIRERYQNLPGHGKYYPAATTGTQNDLYQGRYLYNGTEAPRLLPTSMNMPTTSTGYGSPNSPDQGSPPFASQESFYDIYGGNNGNELVKPNIEAKIEKGFFVSGDNCWTCYRRNYFSVQCSYSLTPHLSNQVHSLMYNGDHKQIQAMAMSLSARVDGTGGKTIELVQHTPKRDKGPQNSIRVTKLCPTPPGAKLGHLPHAEPHPYAHSLMGFGAASGQIPAPYFPLQSQTDSETAQHDPTNPHLGGPATPTAHQHTFERIQFKSATANNGKRRAQQQYYHLIVELWADIRQMGAANPKWVKVAERASSQVVVRGRSPSHYSNEGPTSASSRGGGAGAPGGGGYHGMSNIGYGGMSLGSSISRPLGGYNLGGGYRGNQYTMDPTPMSSHTVSSASSVTGGQVDTFSMDHSSPMILTSQGGPDRLDFMQPPFTGVGLGLPPIISNTLPKPKDESYFMSNRIPPVEVSTRTYSDNAVY